MRRIDSIAKSLYREGKISLHESIALVCAILVADRTWDGEASENFGTFGRDGLDLLLKEEDSPVLR